jgi:hypothetical protein
MVPNWKRPDREPRRLKARQCFSSCASRPRDHRHTLGRGSAAGAANCTPCCCGCTSCLGSVTWRWIVLRPRWRARGAPIFCVRVVRNQPRRSPTAPSPKVWVGVRGFSRWCISNVQRCDDATTRCGSELSEGPPAGVSAWGVFGSDWPQRPALHLSQHDQERARRSAPEMAQAALTRPMWLQACGKLPSSSPVSLRATPNRASNREHRPGDGKK